jgi:3-deoxy-manno-octulosonate cytidylyltransferase (CMP-KDO synthetase)
MSSAAPQLRALAVVPARLGSQRLPRKMLLERTGRALVVHTVENLLRARALTRVVVATDSEEIAAAVARAGFEARLTSLEHASGTDRVFEALEQLGREHWDVVVNVQGDEPELECADIDALVAQFADPAVRAATLCGRLEAPELAHAPQVVKVVRDARGDAMYFSRAAIPFRPAGDGAAYSRSDAPDWNRVVRRHIGVYALRPEALARFVSLPRGVLERVENLEQLRWLEAGERMRVVEALSTPLGIDTQLDYDAFVERVLRARAST